MTKPVIPDGNFTWGEMLHWSDFDGKDIRYPRHKQHAWNLYHLAEAIQPVRNYVDSPMRVISAYRPEPYNSRAGGAKFSQHLVGKAIDLEVVGWSMEEHHKLAREVYYHLIFDGGVGAYPWAAIHLDIGDRRKWGF